MQNHLSFHDQPGRRTRCALTLVSFITAGAVLVLPAAAQAPRFGTDEARFRMTMTQETNTSAMGMSMDATMNVMILTSVKVEEHGRDTLRVRTIIDSCTFAVKSAMLDQMGGMSAADLAPFKKGDSSVVYISPRGATIGFVAGNEAVPMLLAAGEMPAELRPGTSWNFAPKDLTGSAGMADPQAAAMLKAIMAQLGDATKMTFVGEVDRGGGRAWQFTSTTDVTDKVVSLPDQAASITFKRMQGTGSYFIDTKGRVLHTESANDMVQEMSVQGNSIENKVKVKMLLERLN